MNFFSTLKPLHQKIVLFGLYLCTVIVVCWPGLMGDFILDDIYQARDSPFMDEWKNLIKIFTSSVWEVASTQAQSDIYRPFMMASFLATKKIFGPDPFFYHLVNFTIHSLNGVLLYSIFEKFSLSRCMAITFSIIFLLHPLTTEANVWISGIQDVQSLFFPLLTVAFILSTSYEKKNSSFILFGLIFCSFIAKEINVVFFPVLLAALFQKNTLTNKPLRHSFFLTFAIYALAAALYLFIRVQVIGFASVKNSPKWNLYVDNIFWGIILFIKSTLIPTPLKFHRPYTYVDISFLNFLFLWLILLSWSLFSFFQLKKKKWAGLFSIGFLYPFLPLAMVYPSTTLISERYFYVPLVAPISALAFVFHELGHLFKFKKHASTLLISTLIMTIFGCIYFNRAYAKQFKNEETLFWHSFNHPPYSYEIAYDLGELYFNAKEYEKAKKMLNISVRKNASIVNSRAFNVLGLIYLQEKNYALAMLNFKKASEVDPSIYRYFYNLGLTYYHLNDIPRALVALNQALEKKPNYDKPKLLLKIIAHNVLNLGEPKKRALKKVNP